jgi:hypothetical protein
VPKPIVSRSFAPNAKELGMTHFRLIIDSVETRDDGSVLERVDGSLKTSP